MPVLSGLRLASCDLHQRLHAQTHTQIFGHTGDPGVATPRARPPPFPIVTRVDSLIVRLHRPSPRASVNPPPQHQNGWPYLLSSSQTKPPPGHPHSRPNSRQENERGGGAGGAPPLQRGHSGGGHEPPAAVRWGCSARAPHARRSLRRRSSRDDDPRNMLRARSHHTFKRRATTSPSYLTSSQSCVRDPAWRIWVGRAA